MPKTLRRTIVKDGKKVEVIEPEDLELECAGPPPDPSWKKLKQGLILGDLVEATKSVKEKLNRIRCEITPEIKNIIREYLFNVDHILIMYGNYDSIDMPGGRPTNQVERDFARQIVFDYQALNKDPTKFPTGQYLFDRLEEINKTLSSESRKALKISPRTCDSWIAAMKEGKFDPPKSEDFF
jgi:hypothetical protein